MIATTFALVLAMAPAAPQRVYRCVDARGQAAYQDMPCDSSAVQSISEGGEQALRRWLDQQRESAPSTRPATPATSPRARTSQPPQPRNDAPRNVGSAREERLIAGCSERFLHCANSKAAAMDACIARLPRCETVASGCCPGECIARYLRLRGSGESLAAAVRLALLDQDSPSCARAQNGD